MADLTEFLEIPEAIRKPVLDPGIYVEPNDKLKTGEDARQMAFIAVMRRDNPDIIVHATPNGGRQSDWARIRGKRMGVYAGWPDTTCDWIDGGAYIEFKDGTGKPEDAQIECLNRLHGIGRHVAICRTAKGALAWLKDIGAPL